MIKIAAAALLALTLPAQAVQHRTGTINGYNAEIIDSGSYSVADVITVYGPNGRETISVTCAPWQWTSYGSNTEAWVDGIARAWCF